jgi:hypothetical protein
MADNIIGPFKVYGFRGKQANEKGLAAFELFVARGDDHPRQTLQLAVPVNIAKGLGAALSEVKAGAHIGKPQGRPH